MDANIEAMQNLYENMTQHGYDVTKIPFAIQYNKRDLPNAAPISELQAALNPGWPVTDPMKQRPLPDPHHDAEFLVAQEDGHWVERAPYFEAVALTGDGVFDTLKGISKNVVKTLG
jgi:signal recognition particle receptor subunit beta